MVTFWNPDFSSLEAFQVPLESRLEPLMLVLRNPKTRKVLFSIWNSHFLQMLFFRTLRLLTSFLGPSWRLLARVNPKMAPKINPKRDQKSENKCQTNCELLNPIFTSCLINFGAILGSKTRGCKLPRASGRLKRPAKRLKNVKLSSKSGFSLQELPKSF